MANMLTALRLLLAIPVAWAFMDAQLLSPPVLLVLLTLAIASDYFDGVFARAAHNASARGQIFDHSTDFIFVTSSLVSLAVVDIIHPLLPLLIAVAFTQYFLDSHYLFKRKALRMSFLGRWNGILYFVPLVVVAVSRLHIAADFELALRSLCAVIGYVLMASTLLSILDRALAVRQHSH